MSVMVAVVAGGRGCEACDARGISCERVLVLCAEGSGCGARNECQDKTTRPFLDLSESVFANQQAPYIFWCEANDVANISRVSRT